MRIKKARGYDIRIQRDGSNYPREQLHAWGLQGRLPKEWEEVKKAPDVQRATIFYSAQRRRRADRRQYLDTYIRNASC